MLYNSLKNLIYNMESLGIWRVDIKVLLSNWMKVYNALKMLFSFVLFCFIQEQNFTDAFEKQVASKLIDKKNITH